MKKIVTILTLGFIIFFQLISFVYSQTLEELERKLNMINLFQGNWSIKGKNIDLELYNGVDNTVAKICFINIFDEKNRQLNTIGGYQIILESKKILKKSINAELVIKDVKKAKYLQLQLCPPDTNIKINIEQESGFFKKELKKIITK